jgi:hypothetical protein
MRAIAFFLCLGFTLVLSSSTASAVVAGGQNSTQYTCTKQPGENPTCTCTGGLDCIMMCRGKVCKDGCDVLSCSPDGSSCTCDWQQTVRPSNWKRQIAPLQVAPLRVQPAR